ncbi:hypothetical protein CBM2634_B20031 [Cupriavidus taiwanensis]|uniref:Uncharacterized protein n=1 Tax=Cupriavidus taiwanensis TaxID=164546 RepID=A0A375J802_9BURK|nr:hypothetical protein CBM2634_B20031 [Cupriavidus taiwanensis]
MWAGPRGRRRRHPVPMFHRRYATAESGQIPSGRGKPLKTKAFLAGPEGPQKPDGTPLSQQCDMSPAAHRRGPMLIRQNIGQKPCRDARWPL